MNDERYEKLQPLAEALGLETLDVLELLAELLGEAANDDVECPPERNDDRDAA